MNQSMIDIHMQVMWNRLISVVEEQAQTLIRTAFSTSVREAGDDQIEQCPQACHPTQVAN